MLISYLPWNRFGDGRSALLGHPYYLARSALRREIARSAGCVRSGPLLDVGCGTMPYRDLFPQNEPYDCLEIDQPRNQGNTRITYRYDGHSFGLPDEAYEVVFSSQTLEHSFSPEEMLDECFRVLRPGGSLILAMPFFWPEHEQPYDSQRFTSFGLLNRLELAGFSLQRVTKTNAGLTALVQLLIELVERPVRAVLQRVRPKLARKVSSQLLRLGLAIPYTLLNLIGSVTRALPRDPAGVEMYLDLVVVAEKPARA